MRPINARASSTNLMFLTGIAAYFSPNSGLLLARYTTTTTTFFTTNRFTWKC